MSDVEARLAALEAAVAELRAERRSTTPVASPAHGRMWILDGLREQVPGGAVAFAGHHDTPHGPVQWQWGRAGADLMDADWQATSTALAALGHPVRLRLLQLVLGGTDSTGDLAEDEGLGTTGQLHHHLRNLVAAGWLITTTRGHYRVPPERVVPLLTIISATLPA